MVECDEHQHKHVNGDFTCEKCLDEGLNMTRIILIFLAIVIVLGGFVMNTRRTAADPRTDKSVIVRIFVSALQLNAIAQSVPYKFPYFVQDLLDLQKNMVNLRPLIILFNNAYQNPENHTIDFAPF